MDLSSIEWNTVIARGSMVLGLWLLVWLVRLVLVRRLSKSEHFLELFKLDERDRLIIQRIVDIALLITGISVTFSILNLTTLLYASAILGRMLALALVWTAVWVLVRYLSVWVAALDERVVGINIDPRDLKTMDRLLDYLIIVVGIIISLAILNVTSLLYSALTAAGIISVIIGFAVKDIAANFISGIFLLIDRPFVVGDVIQIKDFSGTVNKISLRSTEITTLDGPIVSIPNSTMAVEPTTNFTLSQDRRILLVVSVFSTADLNLAIATLQEVLAEEKRLLPEKPPSILIDQIREYAVDIQLTAYTRRDDLFATQSDIQKQIVAAFANKGIELAVPLRINVNPGTGPQTIAHRNSAWDETD